MRSVVLLIVVALVSLTLSCVKESEPSPALGPELTASLKEPTTRDIKATPSPVDALTPPTSDATPDERGERYGGILVVANRGDPPAGFDPLRTSSIALHHIAGALFGPGNLVMRCRENMYAVCPYLATSWVTNPGFTEWTFTIRRDVSWHDGSLFTAEDAKFWFELALFRAKVGDRIRAPAYFKGELGDVERVEVLDHDRLRISFSHRNPHFLDVLANPRFKIAHPRHLMQSRIERGDVSINPLDVDLVGLGPFKLESYARGSVIRVRSFDRYWEEALKDTLPYLDGIDYVMIPDSFAMDVAFRGGRLDGGARGQGHYLTAERKRGYIRDLGDDVFFAEIEGGNFRLAFNVLREGPWQDLRVRRAIALWIDKQVLSPQH